MIWYLIGLVIFLSILHILFNCNKHARMIQKVPGPKKMFLFGNAATILKSPVEIMRLGRTLAKTYDGIFSIWIYPYGAVIIYNPEDIEMYTTTSRYIIIQRLSGRARQYLDIKFVACDKATHIFTHLQTILSSMKYANKSIIYSLLKPWLGDGLLISNGTKWQERRKILTPTFHFNILKQFCDIFKENSEILVDNLKKTVGTQVDVLPVLSEFTLNSICETAMGTRLSDDTTDAAKLYKKALPDLVNVFYKRFVNIYLYSDILFNLTPLYRQMQKHVTTIHSFTKSVINQRRDYIDNHDINITDMNEFNSDENDDDYMQKQKKRTAMLDLLLLAHKNGLIDRNGIQEEVDTFMFEGHDTTASGMTYCLMLIANHEEVQDKLRGELAEIFGDSKRPIKMEDLNRMKYMECCIKETLRMYPPVHFISRSLDEPTVLSNYNLPAGTLCHILIYDLHRSEKIYKNPNKFDPDRFLPENSISRHPYAYIPFSAGPRNCIGQKFALMEMKIVIARILQEFYLLPVTRPEDICFTADLILRNNGPVIVKFVKRQQ